VQDHCFSVFVHRGSISQCRIEYIEVYEVVMHLTSFLDISFASKAAAACGRA